jgi:hypothetical protein
MWTKCSDRQPERAAWYLVAIVTRWGGHMVTMACYHGKGRWTVDDLEASGLPIYWQPLPDLPEGL